MHYVWVEVQRLSPGRRLPFLTVSGGLDFLFLPVFGNERESLRDEQHESIDGEEAGCP